MSFKKMMDKLKREKVKAFTPTVIDFDQPIKISVLAYLQATMYQCLNSEQEISCFGSINDKDELLELWPGNISGSYGAVHTTDESMYEAVEAAYSKGMIINTQLHTHPDMGTFFSGTDTLDHESMLRFVELPFTFIVYDGFHWLAWTYVTKTEALRRKVTLLDIELKRSIHHVQQSTILAGPSFYRGVESDDYWGRFDWEQRGQYLGQDWRTEDYDLGSGLHSQSQYRPHSIHRTTNWDEEGECY